MTKLSQNLINWYSLNKRDLPWRETNKPYFIWISEIILQQTRVDQGLDYYNKFIHKFPDLTSLASSHIDEVLKLWQGLGYYSRARNMYYTANHIVNNMNAYFPSEYDELIKLKGIGDYTASAIASICFNHPTPVLDGNVFRFIARYFGIYESTQSVSGKKQFKEILNKLIPKSNPGTFNQAIMEFGALQCTPKNPDCINCIFNSNCFAFNKDIVSELPVKKKKINQTIRYFNYLYIIYNNSTFIEKRTQNDIWKLLYQFPLIETSKKLNLTELMQTSDWECMFNKIQATVVTNYIERKHILSHQKIITRFYKIRIENINKNLSSRYLKIKISDIQSYGIPKLLENYLKNVDN